MSADERFTAMHQQTCDAVTRYVARRVDPGDDADVIAEVYLVAWRRRTEVPDDPLPWLFGVARRVLANHHRSGRRSAALVDRMVLDRTVDDGDGWTATDPQADRLAAAFDTLPEPDREVLRLTAWEDLTPSEAAKVLGCSGVAARMRLLRARARLAAALRAPAPLPTGDSAATPSDPPEHERAREGDRHAPGTS